MSYVSLLGKDQRINQTHLIPNTQLKVSIISQKILQFLEKNPYDCFTTREIQVGVKSTYMITVLCLRILLKDKKIEVARLVSRNRLYQIKGYKEKKKEIIDIYLKYKKE